MCIPKFAALSLLYFALYCARAESIGPFADGTRYCALGDSITKSGLYHTYVYLFHLTRFPGRNVEIINAGISGDTTAGGLRRLSWEVIPARPNIVSIMFGMNDVDGDLYLPDKKVPAVEELRKQRIVSFEQNLRELVKELKANSIQPILITPSIFDETVVLERANSPGRNLALGECAARVWRIAAEFDLPVVDFYGPMLELNHRLQSEDPSFTIVGKDRIHPGAAGHFFMAYLFLKALDITPDVARVSIDTANRVVKEASNCKVEDLNVEPDGITFRYLANALPFPVDEAAKPALSWIPFTEELNRESLTVTGLPSGSYRLEIDGKTIRNYTAGELAKGVNLAAETNTPQYQQALHVLQLFKTRRTAVDKLRDLAFVEHGACRDLPRPLTLDQVKPKIDAWVGTAKSYKAIFRRTADAYLVNKPLEKELTSEAEQLLSAIRGEAGPQPHVMSLIRTNPE